MDGHGALTAKGRAMRDRIVDIAGELVFLQGVEGTSFTDIRSAAGVSKGQLFHYFPGGKAELMRAVALRQTENVLNGQRPVLDALDSWQALQRWRDLLVDLQRERDCVGGCPIGSMASEVAETEPDLRVILTESFARWQGYLEQGLAAMRERGDLRSEADPEDLALAVMTSLQGGLLLTKTTRSTRPIEVALDAALAYLRTWAR